MLSAIEMLLPLIAVVLVVGPLGLMFAGKLNVKNARNRMMAQIALFCGVFLVMVLFQANQFTALAEDTTAAATAVGCSCIGAGWAVAKAAPAALGAVSENPDNFGRAIIFVALGEGVAIYGLLISILILNNL